MGCTSAGEMKWWKRLSNKRVRQKEIIETHSVSSYKKASETYTSPSDGKTYYGKDPRWKRK